MECSDLLWLFIHYLVWGHGIFDVRENPAHVESLYAIKHILLPWHSAFRNGILRLKPTNWPARLIMTTTVSSPGIWSQSYIMLSTKYCRVCIWWLDSTRLDWCWSNQSASLRWLLLWTVALKAHSLACFQYFFEKSVFWKSSAERKRERARDGWMGMLKSCPDNNGIFFGERANFPTNPFTILELQDQEIGGFYVVQKRRCEATKLWNGSLGCNPAGMF